MRKTLDKQVSHPYNNTVAEARADLSDEILCEKVRLGDAEAEEILVYRCTQWVRACARPLFLAGADHEDLVQEGMIGLISAIRQYDPGREVSFFTFAARCVKNRMIAAVRSAGRVKHSVLNQSVSLEALSFSEHLIECSLPNPEESVISRESREELEKILHHVLSPLERRVLALYLEGLSYGDISEKLQKNSKSVDNAIQRIRRKLAGTNLWRNQA